MALVWKGPESRQNLEPEEPPYVGEGRLSRDATLEVTDTVRSSRNLCRQFPSNSHLEYSRIIALLGIHKIIPNIKRKKKEIEDLILLQLDSQQSPKTMKSVSGTYPASFFHIANVPQPLQPLPSAN